MPLSDLFDCTFIINLLERKDRRQAVLKEIDRAGMPLQSGKVEIFPAIRPNEAVGFPSPAVRGCFLSHLGALKEGLRRGAESILIMEDDLILSSAIRQNTAQLSAALQQPWDFVYFGHVVKLAEAKVAEQFPSILLPFTGPLQTSHCYAVREPALGRLVDYLEEAQLRTPGHPAGGPMHLDAALTMFRQINPDVLTLIAAPNLGLQRRSRSDIHSTWFQSAPIFRHAYDLARTLRAAWRGR